MHILAVSKEMPWIRKSLARESERLALVNTAGQMDSDATKMVPQL